MDSVSSWSFCLIVLFYLDLFYWFFLCVVWGALMLWFFFLWINVKGFCLSVGNRWRSCRIWMVELDRCQLVLSFFYFLVLVFLLWILFSWWVKKRGIVIQWSFRWISCGDGWFFLLWCMNFVCENLDLGFCSSKFCGLQCWKVWSLWELLAYLCVYWFHNLSGSFFVLILLVLLLFLWY